MSARVVYSTGVGRMCPECGRPMADCRCGRSDPGPVPIAGRVTARLRLESRGRSGKRVTVVHGLPDHSAFLQELAASLKSACGIGGTVRPGAIELAGDVRDRVRPMLIARGMIVKG